MQSNSDLVLETNIEDFAQYYNEDLSESFAKVTISFSLIDLKTNKVIASQIFKSKVVADSNDALGGADALNKALGDVLSKSTLWLGGICR